jgi:hypothetical protein
MIHTIPRCKGCGQEFPQGAIGHDCPGPFTVASDRDTIAKLREDLAHVDAENRALREEVERLTGLKEELKRVAIEEVETIEADRDALRTELAEMKRERDAYAAACNKETSSGAWHRRQHEAAEKELADALTELAALKTTGEPVAWAIVGDKPGLIAAFTSEAQADARAKNMSFTTKVPLYEHPAPVPPAPVAEAVPALLVSRMARMLKMMHDGEAADDYGPWCPVCREQSYTHNGMRHVPAHHDDCPLYLMVKEIDALQAVAEAKRELLDEHWTWRCDGNSTGFACDTREEAKREGGGRPLVRVTRWRVKR